MDLLSKPPLPPLSQPADALVEAKDRLMKDCKKLERQIDRYKELIGNIDVMIKSVQGDLPPEIPAVVPDTYKGMRLGTALEAYLKARGGFKIPFHRAAEDLYIGGADIGDRGHGASGRLHNLRITLPKKATLVEYDEKEELLWLASTAGAMPPKRNQRKA